MKPNILDDPLSSISPKVYELTSDCFSGSPLLVLNKSDAMRLQQSDIVETPAKVARSFPLVCLLNIKAQCGPKLRKRCLTETCRFECNLAGEETIPATDWWKSTEEGRAFVTASELAN
ncbi:hypothetical protein TcWFU_004652 [Taenia crassiceps]|uniref:Uncharacterized protein n=1 Tax=Taenia crassiceps TaxID=6207 RepID=A0ABR4QKW7_9CEST